MEEDLRLPPIARRRGAVARVAVLTALLAFVIGAGLATWLTRRGDLDGLFPNAAQTRPADPAIDPSSRIAADVAPRADRALAQVTALEGRAALLEERLGRLDIQASAASGNASRAETLLVAVAVRRLVERGEPLGELGDELSLRFGETQPAAVRTLAAFAARPVTLTQLDARLDELAPRLVSAAAQMSGWARVRREVADLFVVRTDATSAIAPSERIERAKLLLATGRVDGAIGEVAQLPGAAAAAGWTADARRFGAAQQALDAIEASAVRDARHAEATADRAPADRAPAPASDPSAPDPPD